MNFMMQDKRIFRYKIRGPHDPDSVLFDMAPDLKLIGGSKTIREFFHMNTIQEIPENESGKKDSAFRKGNILLSFCNTNRSLASFAAIVDPVQYKILWYYIPKNRRHIHTPSMLPNGHILVYVNSSHIHRSSYIEEIDPMTKKIVWKYVEKFPKVIWRKGNGSCQRLPNGNTLISNANGYIYEVTPEKKIVWKWFINKTKDKKFIIYRALLYPVDNLKWLVDDI
jgi:hypothetical protein